jgi:hypothetical protein
MAVTCGARLVCERRARSGVRPNRLPREPTFRIRNSTAPTESGPSRAWCVMRWLALMAKVNGSSTCDAQSSSTFSLGSR